MKTPDKHDAVETLRWFVNYYQKLHYADPRQAMDDAADALYEWVNTQSKARAVIETEE